MSGDQCPSEIRDYYDYIDSRSEDQLSDIFPNVIDLHADPPQIQHPLLKFNGPKFRDILERSDQILEAFLEFDAQCTNGEECHTPGHIRTLPKIDTGPVYELKGFPGVYIYRGLISPVILCLVHATLTLEDVFEPSGGKKKNHKKGKTKEPKEEKTKNPKAKALPDRVMELLKEVVTGEFEHLTAYPSFPGDLHKLKKCDLRNGKAMVVSANCDGIVVIGHEEPLPDLETETGFPGLDTRAFLSYTRQREFSKSDCQSDKDKPKSTPSYSRVLVSPFG